MFPPSAAPASRLLLDPRHRAMLAEMGIRAWAGDAPDAAPAATAAPLRSASATGGADPTGASAGIRLTHAASNTVPEPSLAPATTPSAQPKPASPRRPTGPVATGQAASAATTSTLVPDVAAALQALDWPALQQQLLVDDSGDQPRVLSGHGDAQARWLLVCDALHAGPMRPPAAGRQPAPVEQLLDNMLRACGLSRQAGAFLAYVHHLPGKEGEALRHGWLQRLLQLLQPAVVVLMSRDATHSLLQTREAPGRLRATPQSAAGIPVVVSYPPSLLLGKPDYKARAWADLCRARAIVAAAAGG